MNLKLSILKMNHKKLLIISIVLLLFSILVGFFGIPTLLKSQLKKGLQLRPGSMIRKMWTIPPFAVTFKVYIFNVTNPDQVMNGGKPRVQEVGPYIFDEYKTKFALEDNEEDDTVTYDMKNTWVFRPDLSGSLTGEEIITIPHLLIMGALIATQRNQAPMLPIASKAMDIIFEPKTPFLTGTVMDILFNGIGINCDHSEFEVQAICTFLQTEGKGLNIVNNTYIEFSVLGGANDTTMGRFVAKRGIQNIKDLGKVVGFNGDPEMDVYEGDKCNQIVGTDSTIFPPFNSKKAELWAYAPDLCRSLGTKYIRKSKYNGVPTSYLSMDFGDLKKEPDNQCFCQNPPDGCPPKGTIDLMPCTSAPLLGSKPHFLHADSNLVRNIDGLNPNEDDHDIFIHLEIMSGSPLSAAKRLQFSLDMEPVESYKIMEKLPKVVMPLFWVEESAHLNTTYTNLFRFGLYLVLNTNSAIKWTFLIVGSIGLILSSYLIVNAENMKAAESNQVQVIPPIPEEKEKPPAIKQIGAMNNQSQIKRQITITHSDSNDTLHI